jgi:hypothetical protein
MELKNKFSYYNERQTRIIFVYESRLPASFGKGPCNIY